MLDQVRPAHFGIGKEMIVLPRAKHRNASRERLWQELPTSLVVDLLDEYLGAGLLDGAAYGVLHTLEPCGNFASGGLIGHPKLLHEIPEQSQNCRKAQEYE